MRFIDLALAALIGTSAITGMVVWSPKASDAGAQRLGTVAQLRDRLVGFLQRNGLIQFESSSDACRLIGEASTPTFRLYAAMGSVSCGSPPEAGSPSATLSFRLIPFEVELVAWSPG